MLPKKYRLSDRIEFNTAFAKGRYGSGDGLAIKYAKTDSDGIRIGFSVGKAYSKKATERNRARRMLQEACFSLIPSMKKGYDIIVIAKQKKEIDFISAKKLLGQIFEKSGLLK